MTKLPLLSGKDRALGSRTDINKNVRYLYDLGKIQL